MKDSLIFILKYLLIFLLFLIPIYSGSTVKADSGWDSDYDSSSSWDSGSSWSPDGSSDLFDFTSFSEIVYLIIIFIIYMFIVFIWTVVKSIFIFFKRKIFDRDSNEKNSINKDEK